MSLNSSFTIGGDLIVGRLGYGAMQLTGPGVWDAPSDPDNAIRVLRRAVELGVTLIDTAASYGPFVNEELIRTALYPYPENLVIATKVGITRPSMPQWVPLGRPEFLRQDVELCLRRLRVERIDLLQLHRIDPTVPLADQLGTLTELQAEGKIRHLGLSEVSVPELETARALAPIVSVQNLYNLSNRGAADVLAYAESAGLAFIPWFPLNTGELAKPGGPLRELALQLDATPAQLALAWLLAHSPATLPIPGTASVEHLEENLTALDVALTADQLALLSNARGASGFGGGLA